MDRSVDRCVSNADWFQEEPPGVSPDTPMTAEAENPQLAEQIRFLLDKQVGTLRELKTEARETVKLQTAVLGAFVTGLGVVRTSLTPGGFLPPATVVEALGLLAAVVSGVAFLSVFLLVPRPLTDQEPLLTSLPDVSPTREFRFPEPGADGRACVRFNEEVIRRTEWRLQELQRLNVVGILAFLGWLATQLLV